jgi:hypothetical protein
MPSSLRDRPEAAHRRIPNARGGARNIFERGLFGALVLYLALVSGDINGESLALNLVGEN